MGRLQVRTIMLSEKWYEMRALAPPLVEKMSNPVSSVLQLTGQ